MLAGVAFTDAGVRVLLLVGVTPFREKDNIIKTTMIEQRQCKQHTVENYLPGTGS